MQMEKTMVLYPGLAVSHFFPMMRLAGALVEHGYAVSVALIDPTVIPDAAFGAFVAGAVASMPSVRFHTLALVEDPPRVIPGAQFLVSYLDVVRRYNDHLHDFLCSFTRVHAVVVDSLSTQAFVVTKSLGIPSYLLFTSSAASLAAFAQLPYVLAEGSGTSFKELGDTPVELFGLPPIPASHLFGEALEDPDSGTYKSTMALMAGLSTIPDSGDGILVNTVESLEARAVAALGDPQCLPAGRVMPPVYCLGPFLGGIGEAKELHNCLAWLDVQPDHSVVILCFGSTGTANHSEEQLREIAVGLEKSGHRFLWVVRAPHGDDPDLDALLPDGFMDRTGGRGLVVKQWAPQAEVLRHRATGAFVTHCGWNSVLEGVTAGVPMLCWPLHSEQKMNRLHMVGEMGVAMEMVGWQQGLVQAGEVERKVRLVMESEEGGKLRARVAAHKEAAAAAWDDGGSSRAAFARFLSDVDGRQAPAHTGEGA
ncbi:UDP-glycosyltransferase 88B1-like [Lolium rigidum]|uniref:UDP-glycosyltransferase 88B1-like n=1 Tax=Lolium rigidum TaxID=89674 RepID=UPI001F5CE111|nr:UDP-glycosyltransferase 88B1-like [Lolium rigidum]